MGLNSKDAASVPTSTEATLHRRAKQWNICSLTKPAVHCESNSGSDLNCYSVDETPKSSNRFEHISEITDTWHQITSFGTSG